MAIKRKIRQTTVLLEKHYKQLIRNKKTTFFLLIGIPFLFQLALLLMGKSVQSTISSEDEKILHQPQEEFQFPRCNTKFDKNCITLAYNKKSHPQVQQVITLLQQEHDLPDKEIHSVDTEEDLDTYLFDHPNTTVAGLVFRFDSEANPDTIPSDSKFFIQINETTIYTYVGVDDYLDVFVPIQISLQKALFKVIGDYDLDLDITYMKYPHPQLTPSDIIPSAGANFWFWALLFQMIIQLSQIVEEKETRKRFGMRMMGLSDSSYWLSWFVLNFGVLLLSIFILIASGAMFGFNFFLNNSFTTYFVLFMLFGLNVVALSFFLSTLIKKAKTATMVGFGIFCFFTILNSVASTVIYSDLVPKAVGILFAFLSPVVFSKGINDLAQYTLTDEDPGLKWKNIGDTSDIFPLSTCYLWLLLDFAIYMLLAIYFDNVVPGEIGTAKKPWYFLTKEYWKGVQKEHEKINVSNSDNSDSSSSDNSNSRTGTNSNSDSDLEKRVQKKSNSKKFEDYDVKRIRKKLIQGKESKNSVLKIYGMTKIFRKNFLKKTIKDFKAVDDLYLTMESEQLLALLGPNGSGKTTTINMLTGLFPPTEGTAKIYGKSILSEISQVRDNLGVCPQHDILWDELTAREHIKMFAGLKNLPKDQIPEEIEDRLAEVDLTDVSNQRVGSFSGGMKRRLSVAIALTGSAEVVLLDEPTTGMDPVARRHVWEIIEKAKKKRVILLTTHSMEEADILSDKIAIIAAGKLRCVGSSLHLKNKFGTGYRISIIAEEGKIDGVKKMVKKKFQKANFLGETITTITIEIPRRKNKALPQFFEYLEKNQKRLGISDFSVSLTTLEEVFLNIAERAADERILEIKEKIGDDEEALQELEKNIKTTHYSDNFSKKKSTDDDKKKKNKRKKKKPKKDLKKKISSSSQFSSDTSSTNTDED
ncbi:abc transporter a family member 1-related [Anaeramoeba flamelloides]|uniref:Abc transporter a family member 1-related n=1 Tax=Anaeramoeba flamelloides TaxID=1746091 RepID=A0AAV7YHB8_9EUKA|nr:abc transporter a family member 1-related [Anaeramoeba flamelloides]